MRFPPSFLDELRARLPISEVVGKRIQLKRAGREWKGLSPFNKERTPSFTVNDQKGFFHDFSSGKHGDIFGFVMETEGLAFPEAVERLAAMAGMQLPAVSAHDVVEEQRRHTLYDVLEHATKFFELNLAGHGGAAARGYLADRGISPTAQLEFRLGYAPAHRYALKEHLGAKGIAIADMIEAGLLISGDDIPIPYDRFRDRVIIPIHDQRGRVIAFGGRTLKNDVQPKYLNSPETSVFQKGSIVFNFHRARQAAHESGSVVVVEGYMDAIAIFQAGLKSVVASMGTAFTENQIASLWRLAAEPVVCFDADRAGVAAAYRAIDRILPELRVGRTFRFAFLEGEKDPDDYIREKGIDAFRSVLSGSLPLWDMLWERETQGARIETPDGQAALEQKLKSVLRTVKDRIVYVAYERTCRMQLANLFWQAERARRSASDVSSPKKGFIKSELTIPKEGRRHGLQKVLLGLLVHYPDFLEDKSDQVSEIHFSPSLEEFRQGLHDLLIMQCEISVQIIYSRLKPAFYEVLQDIHGEQTDKRPWGHRLFERFPILRSDPPRDFISRCIDLFVESLRIEQISEDIELIKSEMATRGSDLDEASSRMVELVKDLHLHRDLIAARDKELAEEASELRRVWGSVTWGMASAGIAAPVMQS